MSTQRRREHGWLMTLLLCVLVPGCGDKGPSSGEAPSASPTVPSIRSDFELGDEGWTAKDFVSGTNYQSDFGDEFHYQPAWAASGGTEGGHIRFKDRTHFAVFFLAPPAFLGDLSAYVGGELKFAARTDFNDWDTDTFVMFVGVEHTLYYDFPAPAYIDIWEEFVVPLDPSAPGWRLDDPTGDPPPREAFEHVLSELKSLRISAEFARDLKETSAMDSVVLRPSQH